MTEMETVMTATPGERSKAEYGSAGKSGVFIWNSGNQETENSYFRVRS